MALLMYDGNMATAPGRDDVGAWGTMETLPSCTQMKLDIRWTPLAPQHTPFDE